MHRRLMFDWGLVNSGHLPITGLINFSTRLFLRPESSVSLLELGSSSPRPSMQSLVEGGTLVIKVLGHGLSSL
ncbi:MAG: hypothetical protein ACI9US_001999 [Gammaproteobacteria bacterium]|jgi:hypothetical protein